MSTVSTAPNDDCESRLRACNGEISLRDAASRSWDVVVIGAGPAGSLAARLLANRGRSVLLIEAKTFPRNKVCGGCLNARTLRILSHVGLGRMPIEAGGVPFTRFQICLPQRTASLSIPEGISLSRLRFDQELLLAALNAGCRLLPQTMATVNAQVSSSRRTVLAQQESEHVSLTAACVICADGLRRFSVRHIPELSVRISPQSYVGVGTWIPATELPREASEGILPGTILMAVGSTGYAGLARTEQAGLSIAAAIHPAAIKTAGSTAAAIAHILSAVGRSFPEWVPEMGWIGTPSLTSAASRVGAERLFVVGDAAGYVEPFTGEGIAAALESAWLAAPLVDRAVTGWHAGLARLWETAYNRSIRRQQWICRCLTWLLRHPSVTQCLLPWILTHPAAVRPLVTRINSRRLKLVP